MGKRTQPVRGALVGFFLVFAWIAILLGLQRWHGPKVSFRASIEGLLTALSEGEINRVYASASPRFRNGVVEEKLEDISRDLKMTLGNFRAIRTTIESDIVDGERGRTGYAVVRLDFERGVTTGTFSFHAVDDRWLLLGFDIDVPEARLDAVAPLSSRSPLRAPQEVEALASSILARIRDGGAREVYAQAARQMQAAVDLDRFVAIVLQRQRELGRFVRVLETMASNLRGDRKLAQLDLVVEFERSRAKVHFDFVRDNEAWALVVLHIEPGRPPTLEEEPTDGGAAAPVVSPPHDAAPDAR